MKLAFIRKKQEAKLAEPMPIRADHEFTFSMARSNLYLTFGFVLLTVVCLACIILAIRSMSKDIRVAVVDSSGLTHAVTTAEAATAEAIQRQLVFYSREFTEAFLSVNHVTIRDDRKKVLGLLHPSLTKDLEKQLGTDATEKIAAGLSKSYFIWNRKPAIFDVSDPKYSVLCEVVRVTKTPGYKDVEETFNLQLEWGRDRFNRDFFNRPHSLVLLNVKEHGSTSPVLSEIWKRVSKLY